MRFELSGGNLALDFANTRSRRRTGNPIEWLLEPSDVAAWANQAGIVSTPEARRFCNRMENNPGRASRFLERARALREAVFATMSATAKKRPPLSAELVTINQEVAAAFSVSKIMPSADGQSWSWAIPGDAGERIISRVARSTAELLLSHAERQRIRECECSWLFLDNSRNQSRRWCDMRVCGNRAKARRFRSRSG